MEDLEQGQEEERKKCDRKAEEGRGTYEDEDADVADATPIDFLDFFSVAWVSDGPTYSSNGSSRILRRIGSDRSTTLPDSTPTSPLHS
jgi:hypothetical protein